MNAESVYLKGIELQKSFSLQGLLPALRAANEGAIADVKNTEGCLYYQWSSALMEWLKPKQVVELGGAMGVWDVCVLHNLPKESKLYSVTLQEPNGIMYNSIHDCKECREAKQREEKDKMQNLSEEISSE